MKLTRRIPLFFSFLFSGLLATVLSVVYLLFANFRKTEFKDRLSEKARTTVKILLEVEVIDRQMLRTFDRNSINALYNEKTIVFDEGKKVIYSSIDDAVINWSKQDLDAIKARKELFRRNKGYDVLGIYYEYKGRDYYVLISAEDTYGIRKLAYLKMVLFGAFAASTVAIWLISFLLSKRTLRPLDLLRRQMQDVTSRNLTARVAEPAREDEIKALSRSFNQMLDRIDLAYKSQRDFTSNASHELRTPLSRIVMQLENLLAGESLRETSERVIKSVVQDTGQLSDIVTSLLFLSRAEEEQDEAHLQWSRLDEILFAAGAQLAKSCSDFRLHFEILPSEEETMTMEVGGDETLLGIALLNLLKNAYTYSDDHLIVCEVRQEAGLLLLSITNQGDTPDIEDTGLLFRPFSRGSNSHHHPGSGIGLSIVRRVLERYGIGIRYHIPAPRTNQVLLSFPTRRG
ncbi:HAMP domain-containing protein [Flaviaesturariibacter flavus]|uniref:histidine kinase n=1 Tax=Flaviaesturariibacter flavus TaxID=2502780 RepID=A0A4R1B2V8_9BACT|nr:histidine kinase dimerization/phospho-acceptor domain-containing protein [Flaviaesturariibacter flavus]TCJ12171.1 HAMP domain-containing protein [Flaviaesturariibacter flavus]